MMNYVKEINVLEGKLEDYKSFYFIKGLNSLI